ncbi:MAG: hypothetical protein ACOXZH_01540 [Bacteroidales bacterium]|jgi:hypothetical protein
MKKIRFLITAGILFLFLCSTCRKEHIAPINQLVKDLFCFKAGSEWTYYDSVSQTTQKMMVTNYEIRKFAPMPKGGRGKIYDCAESITMDITVENASQSLFIKGRTWLIADIYKDNTLEGMYITTPVKTIFSTRCNELSLRCDENNNFTPSATYLSTYTVNEITYSNVYVFNKDNVTYYVSKHTGFIRCVENNYFDLILIDKNIQQ